MIPTSKNTYWKLNMTLKLTSHWPELSHMATPDFKGA